MRDKKRNIVTDQTNPNYDIGNEIICNTEVLESNLCDYDDAYILVRGDTAIIEHQLIQVAFKICASFTKRITKNCGRAINDAEDLDLVTTMCNLIKVQIILKQQEVNGFILKKKELLLMLILLIILILNLLNIGLNY